MSGETIDCQCQHADIHQRDGQAAEGFRDGLAAQAVAGFRYQQHCQHIAKAAAKAKAKRTQLAALEGRAKFGFWEKFDDSHTVVRIATSWATRMEEIEQLIALM